MKIAIIEDRIGRMEHFVGFDLSSRKSVSVITGTAFDELMFSIKAKETHVLDEFACIAAHRSALDNDARDKIKDHCKSKNKSLVFFSGGISSSIYKESPFQFLHINSKDFYSSNLEIFIDEYDQTQSVNLLMLQFGKRWKLSLLLNLRNNIAVAQNKQILKNLNPKIEVDDKEVIKRVRDLQINSLIMEDLINDRTRSFLLSNEFTSIGPEQINEVRLSIDHLLHRMI